ncbi:MAG: hypothetical protein QG597_2769 [Actinomycetota bacterium]|nr:hypothetical protein [Actinomycetota bacterium]
MSRVFDGQQPVEVHRRLDSTRDCPEQTSSLPMVGATGPHTQGNTAGRVTGRDPGKNREGCRHTGRL